MNLKTIKIFIASSAELITDREDFRLFISIENDRLHKEGIYLELVQWEYFLDAISDTRLQDEYNKAIKECDIALCLFFTKVGKYTAEEFDTAYQVFKDTGRPKIWTYFKDAPVNSGSITEEIMTLFAFKKKIGALGHFYTGYTNIDNLKIQFKRQLENILPRITGDSEPVLQKNDDNKTVADEVANQQNVFNEILTRRLMEAIQVCSPRAKKFIENASCMSAEWQKEDRFSDPAKEIIAFSFVGVLGIQLRKLVAIGKEDWSENKKIKYLQNCELTAKRALQLLCFALISKLWDYKKDRNYTLTLSQAASCNNFFDQFELNIIDFTRLLTSLTDIYLENNFDFPIEELKGFKPHLAEGSELLKACYKLNAVGEELEKPAAIKTSCIEAETCLTTVLEAVKFLANYRMMSIKRIDYFEMRNSKPHYLYNYTALGIDSKSNINQERVNYAEAPINTDAVLLYKGSYQQNLNLFPFIIDVNALAFEGGAKICFYASHDNAKGSLNYHFMEDNSIVPVKNTGTLRPGLDINEILLDPGKRKDMRFDTVFSLFRRQKGQLSETTRRTILKTLSDRRVQQRIPAWCA